MPRKYRKVADTIEEEGVLEDIRTSTNNKSKSDSKTYEQAQSMLDQRQTYTGDSQSAIGHLLESVNSNNLLSHSHSSTQNQGVLGKRTLTDAIDDNQQGGGDDVEEADDSESPMDFSTLHDIEQQQNNHDLSTGTESLLSKPFRNIATRRSWDEIMEKECAGLTGQGLKRAEWRVRQRRARETKILRQQNNLRSSGQFGRLQSAPVATRSDSGGIILQSSDLRLPPVSVGFTNPLENHQSSSHIIAQPIQDSSWTLAPHPSIFSLSANVPSQGIISGPQPSLSGGATLPSPSPTHSSTQQTQLSSYTNTDFSASAPRSLGSLLSQLSELAGIISAQVQLQRRQQDLTINSIEMLSDLVRSFQSNERVHTNVSTARHLS